MTTTTTPAPTCTPRRGFAELPCPLCGKEDSVRLDLAGVDGDSGFHCEDCGEDFGTECVRRIIDRWTAVLQLVECMPEAE